MPSDASRPGRARRLYFQSLRLTTGERAVVRARAHAAGLTVSEFLRRAALGKRVQARPGQVRRAVRDYRGLSRQVLRSAPAARSARRRIPQLRRRARIFSPVHARGRLREGLVRTARQAGGIGVRSLLARAAPGLGSALTLVRVLRRLGRELNRGDRGR